MRIYNTLTHKKQEFKPMKEGEVGMYSCGPTVYNFQHIGNFRAFIVADMLKRVLLHGGYKVKHVMNITDVGHLVGDANLGEDKIRVTAQHEHKTAHEVAKFYTDDFLEDIKALGIMMPEIMPKATDHVREMLDLIAILDKKGFLYNVSTGVYFDTSKVKDYGRLMNLSFEKLNSFLITGARVERAQGIKNTTDFAVWRFSRPDQMEMVWETKYGKGFPGWHIECSAMSMKYLGQHFDIHTGGVDHLPIHHTNEIAQSESATGKKFVNYWVHNEFLLVDGKKMSKSIGNVYTPKDLQKKGYSAGAYKYLMVSAHYRTQLNFTFQALDNSKNTLEGVYSFMKRLASIQYPEKESKMNKSFIANVAKIRDKFFEHMNDDLDTPLALAQMHALISTANKLGKDITKDDANLVIETLLEFDKVLGLGFEEHTKHSNHPDEIMKLVEERESYRKKRMFADADRIRDLLKEEHGVDVEDSQNGPVIHKLG